MTTIVPEATVNGQTDEFDTTMKSTVNHGGSTVITRIGYSEWLGRHDLVLNFPGRYGEAIYLDPAEARDLIASLQAQLVFMGEEYGVEEVSV
ncbi:hypothetical protein [Leucobacter ruminantium]|uniref:Uncharacterized protein n=1 Tax=Leucobacter ruminantium TaxID=1289170 RepID=A0A939LWB8_9MICO|nr:hypothetical protein [Leucobacter ruminantium]MBO1805969.1 hypothetical protein [Leucobacter ruminantium]